MVKGIENSIVALDLDSQGQFIALTNAVQMQLESGAPAPPVVRLLGDAILTLADARRVPDHVRSDLDRRIAALCDRVSATAAADRGR